MARWRRGNAAVCKTATAPVRFRHAPPLESVSELFVYKLTDSYVLLNSLFEPCSNRTEKARSKNRRKKNWRHARVVDRASLEN